MKKVIHKADTRGHSQYDWLDSYHTFSFDEYFDSDRINFGALRVLNDDKVAPGEGFQTHPHKNMEVVSIPLKGKLRHGDSVANIRTIIPGDIQVMSTGSGILHSEYNGSDKESVEFLQIWVFPNKENTPPEYNNYDIRELLRKNELALFISPDGSTLASILQNAWFSMGKFDAGKTIAYKMHGENMGVYIFIIDGKVEVAEETLLKRDGIGIWDISDLKINVIERSDLLLIEVPMIS